jgi:hypothetical protein
VDWGTLASTAVGAAVALGGSLLANVLHHRDQRERDSKFDRRRAYLDFLLALNGALARLRFIAASTAPMDTKYEAGQALGNNKVYEARERMLMGGDQAVLAAAENAFKALVRLRRTVGGGARRESAEYHQAYHAYARTLWNLRLALRQDLGNGSLAPADLDRDDWDSERTCAYCRSQSAAVSA